MVAARKCLLKRIFAVSSPLPFDAVRTFTSLTGTLDIRDLLKSQNTRVNSFSTVQSPLAPCVTCTNVPVSFWKTIDHNNRSSKRQIGKLQTSCEKNNSKCNRLLIRDCVHFCMICNGLMLMY